MDVQAALDFLNKNSGALSLVFSGVVAFATVVYAVLTRKLVDETKKLREAQTEPLVFVTIQPREEWISFIDMVVQNIGSGPAYDVKFNVEQDFTYRENERLSSLGLFRDGIGYMAPGQRIQFFLTSMIENFDEKVKSHPEITVMYTNSGSRQDRRKYILDFGWMVGMRQLGTPPLTEIAKAIKDIQRDINFFSTGFKRLGVEMYAKQDVEEEEKERSER